MPCKPLSRSPTPRVCAGGAQARAVAFGRDPADRGAGEASRRAAAAADHAVSDADRCRDALSGARPAHPCRCRGGRKLGRGRADPAERPAGGVRAGRIRAAPCQPDHVGLSEALCRSVRRIAAVGPHDQSGRGRRRSCGQDRSLAGFLAGCAPCRRDAADRGCLASAYLKARGEPKTPEAIASHDTIQFGARRRSGALSEDGREIRVTSRRASSPTAPSRDPVCGAGRRPQRVMAYQAAEAIKGGRLRIVLSKFEPPPLPIHIVYPTSRLLSAKVRAFIDLVIETSDGISGRAHSRMRTQCQTRNPGIPGSRYARTAPERRYPAGTTRNVPLARAMTMSSALIRHCAKQIVLPVLITSLSTASHCPTFAEPMKSTASPIVTSEDALSIAGRNYSPSRYRQAPRSARRGSSPRAFVCGIASRSPMMTALSVRFE